MDYIKELLLKTEELERRLFAAESRIKKILTQLCNADCGVGCCPKTVTPPAEE